MDFEELRRIVSNLPGLSQNWSIVLLTLLKQIQKVHFDRSTNRFFPWTLRADSSESGLTSFGDDDMISATAIGFPYLKLGPKISHRTHDDDQKSLYMSLFEWDDRFESAKEWDLEQSFCLLNDDPQAKDTMIHVPHVWAITFNNSECNDHTLPVQD